MEEAPPSDADSPSTARRPEADSGASSTLHALQMTLSPPNGPRITPDQPLVLVVADDVDLTTYVRQCLVGHYQVIEAHDAETALQQATLLLPVLILVDAPLPAPSGYALCRRLRAEAALHRIPVVLMAGPSLNDVEERARTAGASGLLTHPFNRRRLLAALEAARRRDAP